jgi:hypothetical protein
VPADNFSVRWSGQLEAPLTGTYRLRTLSDDGVRVWLNGALLVDNWTPHGPTADTAPALFLVAGQRYDLVVEYNDLGGGATMQLSWLVPGAAAYVAIPEAQLYPGGAGLRGQYFANNALTGTPVLTRTEPLDFAWGQGAPGAGVPANNFSVRWQGQLSAPTAGSYRLQTLTDDGIRVWLNGVLIIDNWTPHSPTTDTSAAIALAAGQYVDLRVEYNELAVDATMRLLWQTPGAPGFVTIPASQLHGI